MTSKYRIILIGLLAAYTPVAQAQDTRQGDDVGLLSRPARLEVDGVSLETAIRQLSRRSGVPFAFSPDLLQRHGTVNCSCHQVTVGVALDTLLKGTGLVYRETANRVVLSPPVAARSTPARVERGASCGLQRCATSSRGLEALSTCDGVTRPPSTLRSRARCAATMWRRSWLPFIVVDASRR